jgi:hypothetical protein
MKIEKTLSIRENQTKSHATKRQPAKAGIEMRSGLRAGYQRGFNRR